ncbi:MAG: TlpA family protein disulfide reductase [Gammaproteobacteria bacterium]|nr:TlpA family protein disulfide reductase [Gammaproteobacteria bacterium]
MNRNTIILLLVSTISMIIGVGLFQVFDAPTTTAETDELQTTSLASIPFVGLDDSRHELGDWQEPVIIVNFWAPWCVPCRREIPALIEIQKQYDSQVKVLGVAFDSVENIEDFERSLPMNYPSFIAGSKISMYSAAFGNSSGALPFTAFIDKNRELHSKHLGELTIEQMREKIAEML